MCKCILLLVAIIFPPAAVLFDRGCDFHLCINIILTLLGFIPGVIHAIYVLFFADGPAEHHHHYHHRAPTQA